MFDSLSRTIRFGFRSILKNRLASLTIILSLGVGMGITTTAFSLLNALVFADLPGIVQQDRLMTFGLSYQGDEGRTWRNWFSWPELELLSSETSVFSQVAASGPMFMAVDAGGGSELVEAELVTANYFRTLGARPTLGRFFGPAEAIEGRVPGSEPQVAVLSHRFWKAQLAGDPGVVGRTIWVNGQALEVIGVAGEGFTGMTPEDVVAGSNRPLALWIPLANAEILHPSGAASNPLGLDADWLRPVGRLADGVSKERAETALTSIAGRIEAAFPGKRESAELYSGDLVFGASAGSWRPTLTVLGFMVVPFIVLLVACANAANLLLARNAARQGELSIQKALGASRGTILVHLLTESLFLSLAAGTIGLVFSLLAPKVASLFSVYLSMDVALDWRVFGFGIGASLFTGLAFGLVPALRSSREDNIGIRSAGGRWNSASSRVSRLRDGLVVAQIALGLLLLVFSGLFVRSAQNGLRVDSGLDEERLLLLNLNLDLMGSEAPEPGVFFPRLRTLLRHTSGIEGVALAEHSPLQGYPRIRVTPSSQEVTYGDLVSVTRIGDGYLEAVGIPVLSGRDLVPSDTDGPVRVAMLNQAAAKRLFPDSDPLGNTLSLADGSEGLEVIGIVGDVRASIYRQPEPIVYLPRVVSGSPTATYYIRTATPPHALRERVKSTLARLAPHLPVERMETAAELRSRMLKPMRMSYLALGFLGGVAVALAGAGLYGVMAYSVSLRKREIGIRMALGAEAPAVVRMVVGEAFRLLAIGLGIGMALSAGLAILLRGVLFGVSPMDPWVYMRVGGLLSVITLLAALLPAIRATKVDPITTIATE